MSRLYFMDATTEQRLAEETQDAARRYSSYTAWCEISGVKAKSFETWQKRRAHNKVRGMCIFCVTGRHLECANPECTCRCFHSQAN